MKKALITLAVWFIFMNLFYFFFAFVLWELDAEKWTAQTRGAWSFFVICASTFFSLFILQDKETSNKNTDSNEHP